MKTPAEVGRLLSHDEVRALYQLIHELREKVREQRAEIARLGDELETERMRLAACGVLALSNTTESAAKQRADAKVHYWSGSADDVCRAVDAEMTLRDEIARLTETINHASKVMKGDGVMDQGEAWDQCLRILDAALARKATT